VHEALAEQQAGRALPCAVIDREAAGDRQHHAVQRMKPSPLRLENWLYLVCRKGYQRTALNTAALLLLEYASITSGPGIGSGVSTHWHTAFAQAIARLGASRAGAANPSH